MANLSPLDPVYTTWRIVPRATRTSVARTWEREDGWVVTPEDGLYVANGYEPMPLDQLIEQIELDHPLPRNTEDKQWLWKQIAKGRKYALPHQVLVDLYVIWTQEIGGSQQDFCRDMGEKDKRVVKRQLRGEAPCTWDQAATWATNLSLRLLGLNKQPVTFTFNPLAPGAARCLLRGPGGGIGHYYGKWAQQNPEALRRSTTGRRVLSRLHEDFDELLRLYLDETRVAHRLLQPVTLEVDSLDDIALALWQASGLTMDAWHQRLGLEEDYEPVFRNEDSPISEDELRRLNRASYRYAHGLRAKWKRKGSRWAVELKPGATRKNVIAHWLAPTPNTE